MRAASGGCAPRAARVEAEDAARDDEVGASAGSHSSTSATWKAAPSPSKALAAALHHRLADVDAGVARLDAVVAAGWRGSRRSRSPRRGSAPVEVAEREQASKRSSCEERVRKPRPRWS
jgi:hypothetical protein